MSIGLICAVARQPFPREVSDLELNSCRSELSARPVEGDYQSENLRFWTVVLIFFCVGALTMNFWSRIPCITLPKCRGTSPQEPRGPCLCGLAPLPRRCEAKLGPAQLPGCGAQGHLDGTGAATAAAGLSVSSYLRPIPPSSRPGCLCQCGVPRRTEREPVRPGPGRGAWVTWATSGAACARRPVRTRRRAPR